MRRKFTPDIGRRLGIICRAGLVLTGLLAAANLPAQKTSNWRIFNAEDGLNESSATAVTVGPRGTVWVWHGETETFSALDGYTVTNLPAAAPMAYHLKENLSQQWWTISSRGVQTYRDGQWVQYPIPAVEMENRTNLLRRVRPISIVAAERDHVLLLLSDRLLDFNATRNEITVLRTAQQTKLGRFFDMTESRDGGAWITGSKGLAYLKGPLRRLPGQVEWRDILTDESLRAQNLQRPVDDEQGGVTTVADPIGGGRKFVVHFDGQAWSAHSIPDENIRQAWHSSDGVFWAMTIKSLFRFAGREKEVLEKESFLTGQNYDAVVEPKGIFWIATSERLLRYAPLTWRVPLDLPSEISSANNAVEGITEDAAGRLWLLSADALLLRQAGAWRVFPLPREADASLPNRAMLAVLANGQVAFSLNDRIALFSPGTERFEFLSHPDSRTLKLLGPLNDGTLCVQARAPASAVEAFSIEAFNGSTFVALPALPASWAAANEPLVTRQMQNGDLWLGGTRGVAILRQSQWQTFGAADGWLEQPVFCMLEVGEGKIWCGTRDRIMQFDGKRWSLVRAGFDRVNTMFKSRDGSVWVAAGNGVIRFWNGAWVLNSVEEGLPSASINSVSEDRSGTIWAATTRGLVRYHPEADIDPPRAVISPTPARIKASADGVIALEFSGADKWKYTAEERLFFSHRLDDGAWSVYAPVTVAMFTNVASGRHRFSVKAMDRNWNEDPRPPSAEFSVVVPWFRDPRLLAISVAALVVILFFAGLAFNRHRRLVRSYAEVEKIVAQRTRELELANQELLHSQKMRALGTFAAGIAHDFNNILSIVKGSTQIIEANLDDKEKIRTRASRIRSVVEQGAGVVRAMLGYSRSDAKEIMAYDLHEVIEATLKLLGDHFLRDLRIRVELGQPARVRGSKDLLQQMLLNLILNAADAMPGPGEIVLRTGRLEIIPPHLVLPPATTDACAFVALQDFGAGIPPAVMPRIFEPFFTTKDLSTKRGTGLGLYMVYEFAKEMGYGIQVESQPGHGTTFTLLLPIDTQAAGGSTKT
ncbi:MAG: hypothetical protein HY043_01585 [Verrucomicrobia bacterium]|nr:hypothetical protein [Verrucomicrobiota bacterium]